MPGYILLMMGGEFTDPAKVDAETNVGGTVALTSMNYIGMIAYLVVSTIVAGYSFDFMKDSDNVETRNNVSKAFLLCIVM